MLEEGKAISKIAKEVNITRQTVYRIKMVRDYLDKWIVNANEIVLNYMLFIYYEILIIRRKESANSHSPLCSTIEILS